MAEEFTLLGMKVGDLATWLGAMGSFAAVVTALRLAKSDGRRRDREAEAKGRVIAAFLFAEVGAMNARVEARLLGNNAAVSGLLRGAPQLVPGENPSVA